MKKITTIKVPKNLFTSVSCSTSNTINGITYGGNYSNSNVFDYSGISISDSAIEKIKEQVIKKFFEENEDLKDDTNIVLNYIRKKLEEILEKDTAQDILQLLRKGENKDAIDVVNLTKDELLNMINDNINQIRELTQTIKTLEARLNYLESKLSMLEGSRYSTVTTTLPNTTPIAFDSGCSGLSTY